MYTSDFFWGVVILAGVDDPWMHDALHEHEHQKIGMKKVCICNHMYIHILYSTQLIYVYNVYVYVISIRIMLLARVFTLNNHNQI